jgi:hypothetical protein
VGHPGEAIDLRWSGCQTAAVSFLQRVREIVGARRRARFPPPPKSRWDLISEAMARPFGEKPSRGPVRAGGADDDEGNEER